MRVSLFLGTASVCPAFWEMPNGYIVIVFGYSMCPYSLRIRRRIAEQTPGVPVRSNAWSRLHGLNIVTLFQPMVGGRWKRLATGSVGQSVRLFYLSFLSLVGVENVGANIFWHYLSYIFAWIQKYFNQDFYGFRVFSGRG